MYNEPLSDEGGFPDIRTSSSESEESLQKKWIKNPNMVKQARKSEKRKSFGNNLENGYNGRPNYLDLQGNIINFRCQSIMYLDNFFINCITQISKSELKINQSI